MSDDESQAEHDARVALTFARKAEIRERDAPARTKADIVEGYAMEFLDYLDGSVPRALSAARVACIAAAGEVAHPGRWRASMRAVELCRRAAGLVTRDDEADPPEPGQEQGGPGAGQPTAIRPRRPARPRQPRGSQPSG